MKKFPAHKIKLLEKIYSKYWWSPREEKLYQEAMADPFKSIVFTILSQNTSSQNTWRAYKALSEKIDISAKVLSRLKPKDLASIIKPGGLHRVKAKRLVQLGKKVMKLWNDDLSWVYKVSKEELKFRLKQIKGIGDKTADVLISSLHGSREALVIDTHMRRIALRLGLVGEKATYTQLQRALTEFLPWGKLDNERLAGLFWFLARNTCAARKPKCAQCILSELCDKNLLPL